MATTWKGVPGASAKRRHWPRSTSVRLASTSAPARPARGLTRTGAPLRVTPWPRAPRKVSLRAGLQMPPATGSPSTTRATETDHSGRPVTNSLVPSSGSTTQTRLRPRRERSSWVSSESHPSPARGSARRSSASTRVSASVTGSPPRLARDATSPGVNRESASAASASAAAMRARSSPYFRDGSTLRRHAGAQVALALEVEQDLLRRLLRRQGAGVDRHLGVGGLLVGVGDAGELLDQARPRLGVEALAVALLADLERGGDVDQH